jgi:hypothetical protein
VKVHVVVQIEGVQGCGKTRLLKRINTILRDLVFGSAVCPSCERALPESPNIFESSSDVGLPTETLTIKAELPNHEKER